MGRSLCTTAMSALAVVDVVFLSTGPAAGAGAATPAGSYTVTANGGLVSLSALNLLGLTGAGSAARSWWRRPWR
jgi:hypothetical protein